MFFRFALSALGCLWRERRYRSDAWIALRDARLAAILRIAKNRTKLGAERLAGVDPDDPASLKAIAPIEKEALMARFAESIVDGDLTRKEAEAHTSDLSQIGKLYRGKYMMARTSGTTGRVGLFVTNSRAWIQLNAGLLARILRHRLIPREIIRFCWGRRYRMAMAVATDGHFITRLVGTFQPLLAKLVMKMRPFSILLPIPDAARWLNGFQPHYLHSYPTYLEVLAEAQLRGDLAIDPEFISLGSERVSDFARALFHEAFPHAEVSETYGATECLAIANQCKAGRMHVNQDFCILEPVDEDDQPVAINVAGDSVLLTNLVNTAQPLIRYRMRDSVTITDEVCPCGCPLPVMRIDGRTDDIFHFVDNAGGVQAHPPIPFEALFLGIDGLAQYQLTHVAQNVLEIQFVTQTGKDPGDVRARVVAAFADYFRERGLDDVVGVEAAAVDQIPRMSEGHKIRQIRSLVARPGPALLPSTLPG